MNARSTGRVGVVMAVAAWLITPAVTAAAPPDLNPRTLQAQMRNVALAVKELVNKEGQLSIKLEKFTALGPDLRNFGPRLDLELRQALKAADIQINPLVASLHVIVEYRTDEITEGQTPDTRKVAVLELIVRIIDSHGFVKADFPNLIRLPYKDSDNLPHTEISVKQEPQGAAKQFTLEVQVRDVGEIAVATGVTADFSADRNKDLRNALSRQGWKFYRDGTRISATEDSPYAVEILAGPRPPDGKIDPAALKPVEPTDVNGQAVVEIPEGHVYMIRVENNSDEETAVEATIDGLSVFTFSEVARDAKHFIFGKGKSGLVRGWHKDHNHSYAFLVDRYSDDGEITMPAVGEVGVITVIFSDAAKERYELNSRSARGDVRTTLGPPVESPTRMVERHIGEPRAAISVRYLRP